MSRASDLIDKYLSEAVAAKPAGKFVGDMASNWSMPPKDLMEIYKMFIAAAPDDVALDTAKLQDEFYFFFSDTMNQFTKKNPGIAVGGYDHAAMLYVIPFLKKALASYF